MEMESNNQQCPVPANSNQDRALIPFTPDDSFSILPNKQLHISYHRRFPDGEYFPAMLSPGFRFQPEDDELILDYLNKEINKERPEYIRCIRNVNVYDHSPEDLAEMYPSLGKGAWYFFTSRDRKYLNGKRPNRAARNGYWKATVADKKILDQNGVRVGSKKTLVFFVGKPSKGQKTDWIMHEYVSVHQPPTTQTTSANYDLRLDDCVLCRIYKRSKTEKENDKETEWSETWNPKRVKTQHMGTNHQQLTLEVPPQPQQNDQQQAIYHSLRDPDGQLDYRLEHNQEEAQPIMEQNDLLEMQYEIWPPNLPNIHGHMGTNHQQLSLEVTQNQQQAIQDHSLNGWSYNPDGQLHFGLEANINPDGQMGTNHQQLSLEVTQNQQQAIHDHSLNGWSYNPDGQLHFGPEENMDREQNLLAMEYNLPYINLDELFDCLESVNPEDQMNMQQGIIPQEANNLGELQESNPEETFGDLIPNNTFENLSQYQ